MDWIKEAGILIVVTLPLVTTMVWALKQLVTNLQKNLKVQSDALKSQTGVLQKINRNLRRQNRMIVLNHKEFMDDANIKVDVLKKLSNDSDVKIGMIHNIVTDNKSEIGNIKETVNDNKDKIKDIKEVVDKNEIKIKHIEETVNHNGKER